MKPNTRNMKTTIILTSIFLLFSGCQGTAQKTEEEKTQEVKTEEVKMEEGKTEAQKKEGVVQLIPENEWLQSEDPDVIIFPIAFIWEYETEWLEPGKYGREGELWAYYHPELHYWLFTRETYDVSAQMFPWVLVKPDGTVILHSVDEFGETATETAKIDFNEDKSIFEMYKANGQKKKFNENDMGFPAIEGKGYTLTYERVSDVGEYFFAETDVNFAPLHNFRLLNDLTEAYIVVPFSDDMPDNYLMLEAVVTNPFGTHHSVLKDISPTYYEVNLKGD